MKTVHILGGTTPIWAMNSDTNYVLAKDASMHLVGSVGKWTTAIQENVGLHGNSFHINGEIIIDNGYGIALSLQSKGSSAFIGATSNIESYIGVSTNGDENNVTNNGYINASLNGISSLGDHDNIINNGTVIGNNAVFFQGGGGHFTNSASGIVFGFIGVDAMMGGQAPDRITIENAGLITGITAAINGDFHPLTIINTGEINGTIQMSRDNDVFNTRFGDFVGKVYGGMGNDVVTIGATGVDYIEYGVNFGYDTLRSSISVALMANVEKLVLIGNGDINGLGNISDNLIIGNNSANAIFGAEGKDTLNGGRGNDILMGGDGVDLFMFAHNGDHDQIGDFADGIDHIYLKGFAGINGFDDLAGHMKQVNADVSINLGDGDTLLIAKMQIADLSAADFIF